MNENAVCWIRNGFCTKKSEILFTMQHIHCCVKYFLSKHALVHKLSKKENEKRFFVCDDLINVTLKTRVNE